MTLLRPVSQNDFAVALDAVRNDPGCSPTHVQRLLEVTDPHEAESLFRVAREERSRHFGDLIFVYGFVYFSTHCRNRCSFCYYRRSNTQSRRYRKSLDETVRIAATLADSGVHLIDLTMGEDPFFHDGEEYGRLVDMVARVRRETNRAIMISPGVLPRTALLRLARAGAGWYACYQETHSRSLFSRLRPGQSYERRALSRANALGADLLVEDGILVGVGESTADRAHSLLDMRRQGVQQVRVMGFVPQAGTPLARRPRASSMAELITLATMRVLMPDRLIPASLDVEGSGGLIDRLWAGANVVTSIIPPSNGLAGVSQAELDIEDGGRTVTGVERRIHDLGLRLAGVEDYERWMGKRCASRMADRRSG